MQSRIKYLDAAKFIGIFCIFLGHFGTNAGHAYHFVFSFHVPLFFFLSGCTENLSSDMPFRKYVFKNAKNILAPCFLFAIISVVLQSVSTNSYSVIFKSIPHLLTGFIRNHFFVYSLWFLTCLFVIKIAFFLLRKLFKFKILPLLICSALYLIALLVITPSPIATPRMPYNIDSACYYIIFYALGFYSFQAVNSFLSFDSVHKKITCCTVGGISSVFTAALFFKKNIFSLLGSNDAVTAISNLFTPLIVIALVLIVSKIIEDVDIFTSIGRNTLYLCGSEYIIKMLVPLCFQTVGINIDFPNPLATYIYTFALLVLCQKFLVPIEKGMFKKLRIL